MKYLGASTMLLLLALASVLIGGSDAVTRISGNFNNTALEGEATSLSCVAAGLQSTDVLTWLYTSWNRGTSQTVATVTGTLGVPTVQSPYQGRVQFNGTLVSGQFNLVFNNVTEFFLGTYTCRSGVYQSVADLNVLVKPRHLTIEYDGLKSDRDKVKFPLEKEVELRCRAERTRENAQISWYLDGYEIRGGVSVTRNNVEAYGFETVESTLRREFSRSDKYKPLRCVVQLGNRRNATFTEISVDGVAATVASKLCLAAFALLAYVSYN